MALVNQVDEKLMAVFALIEAPLPDIEQVVSVVKTFMEEQQNGVSVQDIFEEFLKQGYEAVAPSVIKQILAYMESSGQITTIVKVAEIAGPILFQLVKLL